MPLISCSVTDNVKWEAFNASQVGTENYLHIFHTQISENKRQVNDLLPLITPDEVERFNSYTRETDKHRFLISRVFLRLILSKYLNKPAVKIMFSTGHNKKPFLSDDADIHYNLSHAGDYVLIAVSDTPVGVDIEKVDRSFNFWEVLPVSFNSVEAAYIKTTRDNAKSFYLLWTRKEALVKATAKGIDDDIVFMPAMDGTHEVTSGIINSDKDWNVISFEMDTHIASVAYEPSIGNVIFFNAHLF